MGADPVTVIVDVANVMGSRPDGWWRDRAGAAVRLYEDVARLAASGRTGLPPGVLSSGEGDASGEPASGEPSPGDPPGFVMVLEGAARAAAARLTAEPLADAAPAPGEVRVVQARGSGDDAIVDVARKLPGQRLVVTADRELRRRCEAAGAAIAGPGWLLGQLRR